MKILLFSLLSITYVQAGTLHFHDCVKVRDGFYVGQIARVLGQDRFSSERYKLVTKDNVEFTEIESNLSKLSPAECDL